MTEQALVSMDDRCLMQQFFINRVEGRGSILDL